jgi:hypothetical protein
MGGKLLPINNKMRLHCLKVEITIFADIVPCLAMHILHRLANLKYVVRCDGPIGNPNHKSICTIMLNLPCHAMHALNLLNNYFTFLNSMSSVQCVLAHDFNVLFFKIDKNLYTVPKSIMIDYVICKTVTLTALKRSHATPKVLKSSFQK